MSEESAQQGRKIPFLEHFPEDMANILVQRFSAEHPDFMESLADRLRREADLGDLLKFLSSELVRYGLDREKYTDFSVIRKITELARSNSQEPNV